MGSPQAGRWLRWLPRVCFAYPGYVESMGGLVFRCFVQNDVISTPHNGIEAGSAA